MIVFILVSEAFKSEKSNGEGNIQYQNENYIAKDKTRSNMPHF